MINRLAILLALGLLTTTGWSQNFKGGLIAGIAASQVSGDELGGYNKAGIYLGVFTQYPLSEIVNVKMEMNYIQKGSNNPKMIENNIPDISTSYIEMPLSIHFYQNQSTVFEAGLQAGFLLTSTDNYIDNIIKSESSESPFDKADIGAFAGMSYHLNNRMVLNTRISNSILPIRPHAQGATFLLNKGQYNTVLSFTIHYYVI